MVVTLQPVDEVRAFLGQPTPSEWLQCAATRLDELLIDHANCELKAASSALAIIYRYPERDQLVWRMSRLAREELRHFEQVRQIIKVREVPFARLSASRYASALHVAVRRSEPYRLLDTLVVAAFIEARSCERFAALAPMLPADIGRFYEGLLASESRHFQQYLGFAREECAVSSEQLAARVGELRALENQLIAEPDPLFRFHSGRPQAA